MAPTRKLDANSCLTNTYLFEPRLRLHIDMESHLVRLIEVWDALPDGSIVHLEEAWSDYRRIGTLRAPFRRATDQDDGRNRLETTFSSWTPKLRRP